MDAVVWAVCRSRRLLYKHEEESDVRRGELRTRDPPSANTSAGM